MNPAAISWIRRVRFCAGLVVVAWLLFALAYEARTHVDLRDLGIGPAATASLWSLSNALFYAGPLALIVLVVVAQRARVALGEPWLSPSLFVVVGCVIFPVIAPTWILHKLEKRLLLHAPTPERVDAGALVWLPVALLVFVVPLSAGSSDVWPFWFAVLIATRALLCVRLRRLCDDVVDGHVSARAVYFATGSLGEPA